MIQAKCGEVQKENETPNVFTLELETLHCHICFLPFESRVYACKNGHAACASCCDRMHRKCHSCSEPIGDFRCRATEKILAGMTRPCKYNNNGCREIVKFTESRAHEEECQYAPYECPFDGCAFRGMGIYDHIQEQHAPGTSTIGPLGRTKVTLNKIEPFHALLHRDGRSVFLLLNGGDITTGRSLSLVRICPHLSPDYPDEYTMVVHGNGSKPWLMSMLGTVKFVRRLKGFQPKIFLLVPDALWGNAVTVHLDP